MTIPATFDPRQVPFEPDRSGLPAVDAARLTPQALIERFARKLDWEPEFRHEPRFSERSLRPAAVQALRRRRRRRRRHLRLRVRGARA
jgi:hypothetical protein